jgi:2-polyprenyl-6-methoxyphenol hydroxylase-like FAD-dependent oxidoreductase
VSRRQGRRLIGDQAVVIGASMAGLCAARVLSDRFERVCVIDRDTFPTDVGVPRRRVPQGRHPHLLLVAGARLLERWFPRILGELYSGGAVELDVCGDFYWHQAGGELRRPPSELKGPAMTRPYLEATVRRRVGDLPNVELRSDCAVTGLEVACGRTTGVHTDDGTVVPADLTVDATGRQARSLAWVEAAGFPSPPVEVIDVDTRYVSQMYQRAAFPSSEWKAAAIVDDPATKRLAMALPVEGDRWLVMFGGLNGVVPPTEEAERLLWAKSLPSPVIADLMAASEPVGDTATNRFPANQRRRVERLRRFPLGWVLLGDAVCSFDPIYGQGMTSAALQADTLGACLDRHGATDRRFAERYFKHIAKVVASPWSIAVGGDFAYPGTKGRKPPGTDLLNRYMARVLVAGQYDDQVAVRFNEVAAMVRSPNSLLSPLFARRVFRAGKTPTSPKPLAAPRPPTAAAH